MTAARTTPNGVLVAGGAGGIGTSIGRRLVGAGYTVVVADLDGDRTKAVAEEIGAVGLALDVTDPDSVERVVAAAAELTGGLWAGVNAVGWDRVVPFMDTTEEFTRSVLDINLTGAIRLMRAVLARLLDGEPAGRFVSISSDAGRVGSSGESIYSAAKGGVVALTKTVAREVARTGVTVNAICPGPTDTPLLADMFEPDAERLLASLRRAIPMGRLGLPEDVAAAVEFFVSADAGFLTGQTLSVSGGLTMI
jgi:2-hydroxycyclohexanecarboxyl-CoA dehydrogenase